LRLREQLEQEQRGSTVKLRDLQRTIRAEQRRTAELEDEIATRIRIQRENHPSGAVQAIEQIWQVMQSYQDETGRPSSRTAKNKLPRSGTAEPRMATPWPIAHDRSHHSHCTSKRPLFEF
jgi:hypothetical protein